MCCVRFPFFPNIGRGRGNERDLCLYCSDRREVTLACQSSQEGVHGVCVGGVGCTVSRGIFVSPLRVPFLVSATVQLWGYMRVFFSL